jgi:TPR repeat protein
MTSRRFLTCMAMLITLSILLAGCGNSDDEQRLAELTKKAEAGDADAQYNLGRMHAYGDGVPRDMVKAGERWQRAAAQGNAKAQYSLGRMYAYGDGVPRDMAKAREWWKRAAAQGEAEAQLSLGEIYATGKCVGQDRVLAYAWFNLAAINGHQEAKSLRDALALKPVERAEAERLSSEWKSGRILSR